jgi:hypothetical protein
VKRLHGAGARHGKRCERRDIGGVPACITARDGEVVMPGSKSMPDRICEEMLWEIAHFLHTLAL